MRRPYARTLEQEATALGVHLEPFIRVSGFSAEGSSRLATDAAELFAYLAVNTAADEVTRRVLGLLQQQGLNDRRTLRDFELDITSRARRWCPEPFVPRTRRNPRQALRKRAHGGVQAGLRRIATETHVTHELGVRPRAPRRRPRN